MKKYIRFWILLFTTINFAGATFAASEADIMRAIANGRYDEAYRMSATSNNFTRNVATWYYLVRNNVIASHEVYERFLLNNPKPPLSDILLKRMEIAFLNAGHNGRDMAAWFRVHPPISSRAILLFQDALGKVNSKQLNILWPQADFSEIEERDFLQKYKSMISKQAHENRAARLIWDRSHSAAQRLFPYMSDSVVRLSRARIALQNRSGGFEGLINAVPRQLQNDAGLIFDRVAFRAATGNYKGVEELLLKVKAPLPYPEKWSPYQLRATRDAIEQGRYSSAKIISDNHSQIEPATKVEAEWLRGWLYYHFLRSPAKSVQAFKNIYKTALMPISKARGAYWAGRAYEGIGNKASARYWLQKAALFPTAFYGQLAQQKLNPNAPLKLPTLIPPALGDLQSFKTNDDLAAGLDRYVRAGYGGLLWSHIQNRLSFERAPQVFVNLAAIARTAGDEPLAIKIAQEAANKGLYLSELFPTLQAAQGLTIDPAFSLAITRQESRFDNRATSTANAKGLMQILPSTGRMVASKANLGFNEARLYEPKYNMQLGSLYMRELLQKFSGRMMLAIAGYNAGPGRPIQWQGRFGVLSDRDLQKVLQWSEMIPFAETRNYVHRVLENYHVYRHILSNGLVTLQAEQSLLKAMR
jgi:soluble lytic murein transglycosylase